MKRLSGLFQILVISALIFWAFFYHLGRLPFRIWDETRLITSAHEMLQNHKYLTPTNEGGIDMWNTKPPLMIWAEAISIKTFGFSERSARLPAAICGMLTVLITAGFVRTIINDTWAPVLTVVVLCTSSGLIGYHAARSGEYDAMLVLFTTSYLLSFFMYTESGESTRNKYLLSFFVFLTLACLTKGIAGFLFTPALGIYVILRRQMLTTLTNKYLYAGAFIFILFVTGYYLLREHYNPGYLQAVWENELGGRFNTSSGGPITTPDFYINAIRWSQFSTWMWGLWVSAIIMWFLKNHKLFRVTVFCWLASVFLLTVISRGDTRMGWYDLPLFPLMAIIVTVVVFQLSEIAEQVIHIKRQAAMVILVIIFSVQPLYQTYNFIKWESDDLSSDGFYSPSYYLRSGIEGKRDLNEYIYFSAAYNLQWRLYVKWLNDAGVHISDEYADGKNKFNPGDKVIANQLYTKKYIEENYTYSVVEQYYDVKNYLIKSAK